MSANPITVSPAKPELKGNLGVFHLFFSVMAWNAPLVVVFAAIPVVIGLGTGAGAPGAFVIAGIIIAIFAVGFTQMARVLPNPGAFYAYITAGLGKEVGLGAGFVTLVGYFCGYAGALAFGGIVLGSLVHDTFHGPDVPWYLWSLVFWVTVTVLGYLKFELSAKLMAVFLICEILVIVTYDAIVFAQGGDAGMSFQPLNPGIWFDGSFGLALLFALGMFGGFEVTALFRSEARDPERTVPRATYLVIVLATVLYAGTTWIIVNALGLDKAAELTAADPAGSVTGSLERFGGTLLMDLGTALVVTSTFAVVVSGHNIVARYVFNLSADGILPKALSGVHSRHGSPHMASNATSAATFAVTLLVVLLQVDMNYYYAAMLGVGSLVMISVMFLTNFAIPLYMRKSAGDRFNVWGNIICPIIAAVGLGTGVVLAIQNFPLLTGGSEELANILLGLLAILFVGGIILAAVYRRTKPQVYARIGRQ